MFTNPNKCIFKTTFLFLIVIFWSKTFAQKIPKQEFLFAEAENLYNSNPDEALKIAKLIKNNSSTEKEKINANLLLAKIYSIKGEYGNVLKYLFENNINLIQSTEKAEINIRKAEILRVLYLDQLSIKYINEASNNLKLIEKNNLYYLLYSKILLEKINLFINVKKYNNALELINKEAFFIEKNLKKHQELQKLLLLSKAKIYLGLTNYSKSSFYLEELNKILNSEKIKDKNTELYYLIEIANLKFQEKKHKEAITFLEKALQYSKEINNIQHINKCYKNLSINYLAINDGINYKKNNSNLINNNFLLENLEQEAINTAHNLIINQYDENFEYKKEKYYLKIFVFLSILSIILISLILVWYKHFSRKKRLIENISFLEIIKDNEIENVIPNKELNKKKIIPIETEKNILLKLKKFENSNKFTNKDISIAVLAGQFDTNTKYLSEIINKHYHVNYNTYINTLRINYIIQKLKTDHNFTNYKISYLAEYCGFISHSSFATVFKSVTGITPITFIDLLKIEKQENYIKNDENA